MPSLPLLLELVATLPFAFKYGLLLVLAMIEGPILFLLSGVLLHAGAVSLIPAFLSLLIGDLLGDLICYHIGYYFAEDLIHKRGKFFGVTRASLTRAKELFTLHHEWLLVISKATMGFGTSVGGLAALMSAGIARIPLPRYVALNAIGQTIVLTITLSIGYWFGVSYTAISKDFRIAFTFGVILLIFAAMYGMSRYIRTLSFMKA